MRESVTTERLSRLLLGRNYIRIRMRRNRLGLFEIGARMNGLPARLIVDTGAAQTILNRAGAERFCPQLIHSGETAAGIDSPPQDIATGRIDRLTTGRITMRNVPFLALNLDHVNDTLEAHGGKRIDGLVGADFLNIRKAVIDYREAVLYLERRKPR